MGDEDTNVDTKENRRIALASKTLNSLNINHAPRELGYQLAVCINKAPKEQGKQLTYFQETSL
jgi:hypothetical protein